MVCSFFQIRLRLRFPSALHLLAGRSRVRGTGDPMDLQPPRGSDLSPPRGSRLHARSRPKEQATAQRPFPPTESLSSAPAQEPDSIERKTPPSASFRPPPPPPLPHPRARRGTRRNPPASERRRNGCSCRAVVIRAIPVPSWTAGWFARTSLVSALAANPNSWSAFRCALF